jgi:hypothetical protein
MKCIDCQFNLLCHAGRLDSWSKEKMSIVQLCPVCNRLCVGFDKTLYVFECEQRRLGADVQRIVNAAKERGDFTINSAVQIRDIGPGLVGKLTLAHCVDCMNVSVPKMRDITIKYLDEQTEENLTERVRRQYEEAVPAEEDQEDG